MDKLLQNTAQSILPAAFHSKSIQPVRNVQYMSLIVKQSSVLTVPYESWYLWEKKDSESLVTIKPKKKESFLFSFIHRAIWQNWNSHSATCSQLFQSYLDIFLSFDGWIRFTQQTGESCKCQTFNTHNNSSVIEVRSTFSCVIKKQIWFTPKQPMCQLYGHCVLATDTPAVCVQTQNSPKTPILSVISLQSLSCFLSSL